ncbi:ARSB, partial [Symbiodinium necroappetens]
MTGLAEKMQDAGYRTHLVGKWDAGMATPLHTPLGKGYDSWLGYFQHANDYWQESMPFTSTGNVDICLSLGFA